MDRHSESGNIVLFLSMMAPTITHKVQGDILLAGAQEVERFGAQIGPGFQECVCIFMRKFHELLGAVGTKPQ